MGRKFFKFFGLFLVVVISNPIFASVEGLRPSSGLPRYMLWKPFQLEKESVIEKGNSIFFPAKFKFDHFRIADVFREEKDEKQAPYRRVRVNFYKKSLFVDAKIMRLHFNQQGKSFQLTEETSHATSRALLQSEAFQSGDTTIHLRFEKSFNLLFGILRWKKSVTGAFRCQLEMAEFSTQH